MLLISVYFGAVYKIDNISFVKNRKRRYRVIRQKIKNCELRIAKLKIRESKSHTPYTLFFYIYLMPSLSGIAGSEDGRPTPGVIIFISAYKFQDGSVVLFSLRTSYFQLCRNFFGYEPKYF